jgi:hypothetical protein
MPYASTYTRRLVKKRVEEQMLSTVKILRGQLGGFDETTGIGGGIANSTIVYQGRARVWGVNGSGVINVGEGTIDTRQTYVSYPIDSPVARRDDIVVILQDDLSDTDLDGRVFRVLDVDGGGYIGAARKLTCTSFYPSRYWGEQ